MDKYFIPSGLSCVRLAMCILSDMSVGVVCVFMVVFILLVVLYSVRPERSDHDRWSIRFC